MAKAYRAKQDVSFPRVVARTGEDDSLQETSQGTNYVAGSVIVHDSLPREVQGRADSGALDHVLDPISDEEFESIGDQSNGPEPTSGIFVAEHEAEAHALEAGGHQVVPKDQVLEALSAGEEHAAKYQAAVKEAGYDRRPAQEFLAGPRDRVPDEALYGAQTPSGTPYDRGPERQENNAEENEGDAEQDVTRPRPQISDQSNEEQTPTAATPTPENSAQTEEQNPSGTGPAVQPVQGQGQGE